MAALEGLPVVSDLYTILDGHKQTPRNGPNRDAKRAAGGAKLRLVTNPRVYAPLVFRLTTLTVGVTYYSPLSALAIYCLLNPLAILFSAFIWDICSKKKALKTRKLTNVPTIAAPTYYFPRTKKTTTCLYQNIDQLNEEKNWTSKVFYTSRVRGPIHGCSGSNGPDFIVVIEVRHHVQGGGISEASKFTVSVVFDS
uniref:Uncharacterized protein n=1 Tax=Timema poppense TaxID=170557 RepID=A0A7R9H433_TIMPO|nr:unnamed protein product [Timema poppensis]